MSDAAAVDRTSTQQAILDATVELLAEGGEANVRVAEVARRAGITTGAIYSNYESREGLIAAAHVAHMEEEIRRHLLTRRRADESGFGDPRLDPEWLAMTREIFDHEARVRRRRWVEAALMAHRNPELAETILPMAREAVSVIVDQMANAQEQGWLVDDLDPHAMAVFQMGSTLGVALLAGVYSNDDPDFTEKLIACWPYVATAFRTERMGQRPDDFAV